MGDGGQVQGHHRPLRRRAGPRRPRRHPARRGKEQLSARARSHEVLRERAGAQDSNFDDSEVAFQLAIVLGSGAILALSRKVLYIAIGLGVIGTLLMINGFLLMVPLPF